ncbi:flagellar hook protein FlgE [Mesorhizobium koreense]|jgi:flagellar hook protein FlgE|uniref:flagellar hook protein FlgE n=1 Tax=Mesorhizobium koreense TaxID=3074855 RepID=UPI00287B60CF|nr:flagellar hook protein FlgE [Mesorhizobium sp. WR6]
MSLYGMMRTGVSGMNAQANRLSATADNIANSSTAGYKRASTQFSTLVIPGSTGNYNSGGVTTTTRYAISEAGIPQYTTSPTDLAINGDGFFIVADTNGTPYMTRAGNFVPDDQGHLVNAAGFTLLGYSFANGTPAVTANGFAGLEPVTVSQTGLTATPSSAGDFYANLPLDADIVTAADLPSANATTATYTAKSSLVAYDNAGSKQMLDVYFTKTGANTWEVAVFDQSQATAGSGFPYGAAGSAPLATQTLTFDPTTNQLTTASASTIDVPVPNGGTVTLDLSQSTQFGTGYSVYDAKVNGNPPSAIQDVQIADDGTVYAQYDDGSLRALYRIPLATVESPDNLKVLAGNVFAATADSGDPTVGFPGEGKAGTVKSGALENSNVDIAQELTDMIESQRTYTANSKVFQTGSDLMDVLVNLAR